jgi:protein TonB
MRRLRLCCFLLPLAVLSVWAQQPVSPPSTVVGSGAQSPAANGPDTPVHINGSVRPPVVVYRVDPNYTADARSEKISGDVQIYLWVDKNGNPSHVRVVRGIGHGLDEKAVEAVRQFKFKPATKDGEPVTVDIYLDVTFRIF